MSEEAQNRETGSPTESIKGDNKSDLMGDSTQDTIDHMRDMESSGRIDMSAYRGEPNHDDNAAKYGKAAQPAGMRRAAPQYDLPSHARQHDHRRPVRKGLHRHRDPVLAELPGFDVAGRGGDRTCP